MRRNAWLPVALALSLASSSAVAQEDALGIDPPSDEDTADEPAAPEAETVESSVAEQVSASAPRRFTKQDYPTELILRPLTLPAEQAEISLDVPVVTTEEVALTQVLRGAYGINGDLTIGLTYSFGAQTLSPASYEASKAFSLDGAYTIVPGWLAVQASMPFYVDPFAMSVALGVPFRVTLSSKWALFGGQNLLQLKLVKFPVDPSDPSYNIGVVVRDQPGQEEPPVGHLNLNFGALYQARPDMAVTFTTRFRLPDFNEDDMPVSMFIGGTWAVTRVVDVGGRIGFGRVDEVKDSLTLAVFAAYRL
ncbi:MAG: hypothetical protein HY698_10740 [Deltaproteobacteria bacterium]|nr:hypothetical protein [Deltaproteobacteria bacterium]